MMARPFVTTHLALGTQVANLGKIEAVGVVSGERYYWLVGLGGVVSMMPACQVEAMMAADSPCREQEER